MTDAACDWHFSFSIQFCALFSGTVSWPPAAEDGRRLIQLPVTFVIGATRQQCGGRRQDGYKERSKTTEDGGKTESTTIAASQHLTDFRQPLRALATPVSTRFSNRFFRDEAQFQLGSQMHPSQSIALSVGHSVGRRDDRSPKKSQLRLAGSSSEPLGFPV